MEDIQKELKSAEERFDENILENILTVFDYQNSYRHDNQLTYTFVDTNPFTTHSEVFSDKVESGITSKWTELNRTKSVLPIEVKTKQTLEYTHYGPHNILQVDLVYSKNYFYKLKAEIDVEHILEDIND